MARKPKPAEGPAQQPAAPLKEGTKANAINAVLIDVDQIAVEHKHDRVWNENLTRQVKDLAASMAERGLQQPIRVYERGFLERHGGKSKTLTEDAKYAMTFGELRLAAAKMLGWKQIPATIGQPSDVRAERAIENLQRPELGVGAKMVLISELVGEITASVRKDMGVPDSEEVDARTADAIRKRAVDVCQTRTGMKAEQIRDLLFLSDLDETTRGLVLEELLPWQYARRLAAVADPKVRAEIAHNHAAARTGELPGSLRDLEQAIARVTNVLDHVPWKLDVAFADAPACTMCPDNSINQTGLFDGTVKERNPGGYGLRDKTISAAGVCLKDSCYRAKLGAFNRATANMARKVAITVKGAEPKAKESVKIAAPDWANDAKFMKQVREKAKLKAEAAVAPSSSGGTKLKKTKSPNEEAKQELRDAMWKWRHAASKVVEPALRKIPATMALVALAHDSEEFCKVDAYQHPKAGEIKEALDVLELALTGGLNALVSGMTLKKAGFYVQIDDLPAELTLAIAEHCGVKLPAVPTLEDFLPKTDPKKADAAKPGKGGKRAAPASGKKKAKRSKAKPSDDELQAARDMAADAAGEFEPQEEV
jgi:hypothetical protein